MNEQDQKNYPERRPGPVEGQKSRRGSLVGPVILIGLGIVFLLNSLGLLAWSVWEVIFRLWPILLIAGGLEIILNRVSAWGSLLALVLTVIILAGALWMFRADIGTGQVLTGEEVKQALEADGFRETYSSDDTLVMSKQSRLDLDEIFGVTGRLFLYSADIGVQYDGWGAAVES